MTKEEKKVLIASLVSALALILLLIGFKIIAAIIAVPALIFVMNSKQKLGAIVFLGTVFCAGVVGLITDFPFNSYPPALVSLVLFPIIFSSRGFFYDQVGIHSLLWLDLTLGFSNLLAYVLFAYLKSYDLFQWIVSSSPIAIYTFFSVMVFLDRHEATKTLKSLTTSIGSIAPDFALPDQNGNIVSLKELLITKNVLLIFVRGEWCPSCHIMLRGYVKNKDVFAQKDVKVVAVGPDPNGVNKEIMNRIDENSLLLSDIEQETAFRYISTIQENNAVTKSLYKKGIPLPASFLIHKNGKIIFTSRSDKAGEILQPDKIFEVLAKL